jgi:hypothetical protein
LDDSQYMYALQHEWFNYRWEWGRPTVLVSNLTVEQLRASKLYEPIVDRLADTRWMTVLGIAGDSRRRNAKT